MKYVLVLLIVCVGLAAAAPQFFTTWPYTGFVAPYTAPARTVVAGPTVVNGFDSRFTAGFIESL